MYLFGLEILFNTPRTKFAPKARLLVAAPGRLDIGGLHVIYPYDSGAQRLHNAKRLEDIARPNGGGKAIGRVVGDLKSVGFILE